MKTEIIEWEVDSHTTSKQQSLTDSREEHHRSLRKSKT